MLQATASCGDAQATASYADSVLAGTKAVAVTVKKKPLSIAEQLWSSYAFVVVGMLYHELGPMPGSRNRAIEKMKQT
jgi:hypothetical protein